MSKEYKNSHLEHDLKVDQTEESAGKFDNQSDCHAKSLVLTILVWSSFIFAVVWLILRSFFPGLIDVHAWMIYDVIYVIYLGESLIFTCDAFTKCGCTARTCAFLRNTKMEVGTEDFLAQLQCTAPVLEMHIECYHNETQAHTEQYTNSNGHQRTRTVTKTVKVITHTASDNIRYAEWKDCSTKMRGLGQYGVVKIALNKNYEYHDQATYDSFEQQRAAFRNKNDRDVHQDYRETLSIPGFSSSTVCCRHGVRPCGLHLCFYILASLCMLSHVYRLWMERISVKTKVQILKRVNANPEAMQELPFVMQCGQDGDVAVQTAVVYQELYGVQQPNLPTAVAQALPEATATVVVPTAYAAPVGEPSAPHAKSLSAPTVTIAPVMDIRTAVDMPPEVIHTTWGATKTDDHELLF